jgi:CO/xanthine dehydrogenase FAD-binding subunit
MRSFPPAYELRRPASLGEALSWMASDVGVWRPFAGGTDLMVLLEAGKLDHRRFLDLWGLAELRGIQVDDGGVTLGALTTYTDVRRHPVLQAEFPLLCRAAAETGGIATQNRGTLGGNIANASPAADTPPALLAHDAELELLSVRGTRRVPYGRFHTGYKKMDLAPDEIIGRVRLPRRRGWVETYRKVGTRRAQAISKVCVAAAARLDDGVIGDVRIALGGVAPTVVRAEGAEASLRGERLTPAVIARAADQLDAAMAPIDDIRSTARYRSTVARAIVVDFLRGIREIRDKGLDQG